MKTKDNKKNEIGQEELEYVLTDKPVAHVWYIPYLKLFIYPPHVTWLQLSVEPLILGIFDPRSYTSTYLKREAASCFANCSLLDEREQSRHHQSLANIDKPGVRPETVTDPTK